MFSSSKPKPNTKKKSKKSLFKRVMAWLHLWLGMASGIIVVIVSLTGCIYVFENEIKDFIEDWRFVKPQEKAFLLPSQLVTIADKKMKDKHATSVTFGGKDEAAIVGYFVEKKEEGRKGRGERAERKRDDKRKNFAKNESVKAKSDLKAQPNEKGKEKGKKGKGGRRSGTFISVYMNPYTGEILNVKTFSRGESPDFFRWILNGHRALWLPYDIGRPIVGVAVLIFVFLLISGIVLWWPTKWIKSIIDKSFKIKWDASFKRVNYDLHNVFGFYSCIFLFFIAVTGLVWSFGWWSKSLYWVTSGGTPLVENRESPKSDTTIVKAFNITTADKVLLNIKKENPQAAGIMISIPSKPADPIGAFVYKQRHTFYNMDRYSFDQQTLKEISIKTPFSGKYIEANIPDKIRRMNYDIHVGSVLGLTGKIIAFLASLISASLPITGFIIWWGKQKFGKKKAPAAKPKVASKIITAPKLKSNAAQEVSA
ncbi:PepSY-associated TM helix domain-containing protein [Flavobacterium sp. S87F.05.LMB.W.Kidney.N]|uniref:PepSY-associated TM helix domain-containing protein n=1 Tax=Flavobacterium sp. S87F.05.LMB.W.Kidney.N TaxID=1278758 RepID=UPI001066975C|nr:PepSY-associated TM helix domain-containing protein [Flavobacterium sp. S87F.05.LMB.W.Kidney.N]TDX09745.1 putative iron-regulated membrane protein [Flavobacterium sp. S87F.05.LMB.W.Kidney.N]